MTKDDISGISMAVGEWGKIRAYSSVTFNNGLIVEGVKVVQGQKGRFIGMPSVQRKNKESGQMEWKDCVTFESEQDQKDFSDIILEAYNMKVEGKGNEESSQSGVEEEDGMWE